VARRLCESKMDGNGQVHLPEVAEKFDYSLVIGA